MKPTLANFTAVPIGERLCSAPCSTAERGQALSPPSSTQHRPAPGAAPRSSSWGGADRQPIGVGLSQCHWKPKTSSHRRSTDTEDLQIHRRWPHEELPAATQPRISDCTQRSAHPAQRVTELPGLLHPIPPPHPRSVIGAIHGQLRRCPRTAPRGAQQRPRTAPHRRTPPRTAPAGTRCCRGAGISRSREAKSRPAEALILNFFFSSCPARRGAEGCSNAPRTASAAPGGHGRGPRREDTRTRRVCRYRRAISQRGHTHPHGDTHSSTLRGCSVTSAEREGRKRKTGAGAAERPDPTPHRRCSRGERR